MINGVSTAGAGATLKASELVYLREIVQEFNGLTVGINVGLRGSDLLALSWAHVLGEDGLIGKVIEVKESKTGKLRRIAVSQSLRAALSAWLHVCAGNAQGSGSNGAQAKSRTLNPADVTDDNLLFPNGNGRAMSIQRLHQLVREWASKAGVRGHFGSHSLRKTFGYHLRKAGIELPVLMKVFSHSSQSMTLRYLGITDDEIDEANLKLSL
jgi:integrase